MKHVFRKSWAGAFGQTFKTVRRSQVAALCYRQTDTGIEVLVITSRDTKRWILPKGWPIEGLDGPASALQEAWEEAGVRQADITPEPLGTYSYDKRLSDGGALPVEATVYLARVETLADTYPEMDERTRRWVTPDDAAQMVAEPELQNILRAL
ncbi:NUDIX hydrolase [Sulfitobacter guttiformis]|uniref:8-oxo-dGTP pyrophosphatase MutT (NUDIX family) n=1 Tax=Sulfitobacter guttiformis TaxID=74349 RepID=A0A420DUE0_9RHOB|nr:NUDIX hydrolase [Sulfitobacter guttiformis]KIN71427.1 Hydrolase, nudix family [Sulfitobacter guttiformis KCTC 32187]RKE97872.1 8-oxo-dGTP pyrophosphatase MutT (NUDIX family) [Sulfitobacter guttiformis]